MNTKLAPLFAQAPGLASSFNDIFTLPAAASPTVQGTNLGQVIKEAAKRMKDVAVYLDRDMSAVTISAVGEEDIYLQDDEADKFIGEVDKLYHEAGNVTEDEAAQCHAEPFAQNIWN